MTLCEEITRLFPVRKSAAQKKAFRAWLMTRIREMGYAVRVEENDRGRQQNLVVGDPEHASVTFTAHYDTPAAILVPDLQIPRNFPVYLAWQALLIGGMLGISLLVGVGAGLLAGSGNALLLGFFGAFLALMALQLYGFPNKNNVNDNTSGVAALMETMARIAPEDREKAAFIFFDNMEKGRKGSRAYAGDHLEMQHTRFVVNADSVGVGEVFVVSAPALAVQLPQYALLEEAFRGDQTRQARFFSSLTTRVNSDHRSFKCGVNVMACREVPGIGLYLGDLHTGRDDSADQENIDCLAQVFSALAGKL